MKKIIVAIAVSAIALVATVFTVAPHETADAAPSGSDSVWRIQIALLTGDVPRAGTDKPLRVKLASDNYTYLDSPENDFERRDFQVFDLDTTNVQTFADIKYIRISGNSSDWWCMAGVYLFVNGRVIYGKGYYGLPGHCKWVSGSSGSSETWHWGLRSNYYWDGYVQPRMAIPVTISKGEIISRLESQVGNFMHDPLNPDAQDNELRWGRSCRWGPAVETRRVNSGTIHVDLDLAATGPSGDGVCVDLDFDIEFSCTPARIAKGIMLEEGHVSMDVTNAKVEISETSFWTDLALFFDLEDRFGEELDDIIERIEDSLASLSVAVDLPDIPSLDTEEDICSFFDIIVESDGDIMFTLAF